MTDENKPITNINISESIIASVTEEGKIENVTQNNYPPEKEQTLEEAAKEIQKLLDQLSRNSSSPNQQNDSTVMMKTIEAIEGDPSLKERIVNAMKFGGIEAFKGLINHPAVNILLASIEGWKKADDND